MSAPPSAGDSGSDIGGFAFAFGAAAAYGTAAVLIRAGLNEYGSPLTAITVALLTGVLALAPLAFRAHRARAREGPRQDGGANHTAIYFVLASGLSSLLGFSSNTLALSLLPVVVVAPISSIYPLITVLLVRLFLHRSERITTQTVLGAVLIVAGVILVTIFRG